MVRATSCNLTADLACDFCADPNLYPSVAQDACVAVCPPGAFLNASSPRYVCGWLYGLSSVGYL